METPIPVLHLFPKLDTRLIDLLKSLSPHEWQSATLARKWAVKDIAAHLLDGNIRTISIQRDNFVGDPPSDISGYGDVVNYLNRLNADWVQSMKRMSPAILIELLELTGREYIDFLRQLDPFAPATWPVSWAGEQTSLNWFHIAREYTEKWHHQQQIRDAVLKQGIMTHEFYFPMMDTFMRALPHAWRDVAAPEDTAVKINVTGDAGGSWIITKGSSGWTLTGNSFSVNAEVTLDPDLAWKLFTKGIAPGEAKNKILFRGELSLGLPILSMITIMG